MNSHQQQSKELISKIAKKLEVIDQLKDYYQKDDYIIAKELDIAKNLFEEFRVLILNSNEA